MLGARLARRAALRQGAALATTSVTAAASLAHLVAVPSSSVSQPGARTVATLFASGAAPGSPGTSWRNVQASPYEARGDGKVVDDCATTFGSFVVTSASGPFTATDVGKYAAIYNPNGPSSRRVVANNCAIASVQSATRASLSVSASATTTGCTLVFGSDDTDRIQAAVDDAAGAGGGTVYFPPGLYVCAANRNVMVGTRYQGYCLRLRTGVRLLGDGVDASAIATVNRQSNLIFGYQASGLAAEHLTLRGTGTYADPLKLASCQHCQVVQCQAIEGAYGFQIIACADVELDGVRATGQYVVPIDNTTGGGFGISIADVYVGANLVGTNHIRVVGADVEGCEIGAVRIFGDPASPGPYPSGVTLSQVNASRCGIGAPSLQGAFFVHAVTDADLLLCRAEGCAIGFDFQGAGVPGSATASQCRAVANAYQGFRGYGFSNGVLSECVALDNGALAGVPGISLQDDPAGRGSTAWIIRGCRAGNTTAGGRQSSGYACVDANSGGNQLTGNNWTTVAGGTAQYKANDARLNNLPT